MTSGVAAAAAAALIAGLPPCVPRAAAATLYVDGGRCAAIVEGAAPIPSETRAARELKRYLERVTGCTSAVLSEPDAPSGGPRIFVGATRRAADLGLAAERLGPEEWILRTDRDDLVLVGGRPRGTLYAVYHFLEDVVGVRWWNAFEETVPRRPTLAIGDLRRRGTPAFGYRDIYGVDRSPQFSARVRLNGSFQHLSPELGGGRDFGPPSHVHNFYRYVPPERYFGPHPEFFSERAGFRAAGRSQLCLTNGALADVVAGEVERFVEGAAAEARREGVPPPELFDVSPNDWGGACDCARCSAMAVATGARSGTLLAFVNRIADAVRRRHPDVLVDTVAYLQYFAPPHDVRARDNVVVRLAGLQRRDYLHGLRDPRNRAYRDAVRGWARVAPHLWIWDYLVTFADVPELPRPNLRYLAGDLRFYRRVGVQGMFVQADQPVVADLRDLKIWVLAHLLEDPSRSPEALIREFSDGYYGPAGASVRSYLRLLRTAARRFDGPVRFDTEPSGYGYLDASFFREAYRRFDRAERAVHGDAVLSRRVREARLSLDRALLARWPWLDVERLGGRLDRRRILGEARVTVERYVDARTRGPQAEAVRDRVLGALDDLAERGGSGSPR